MNFHNFQKSNSANIYQPNGPRNPLNNLIFEKLSKMKSIAESRGFKNQAFCYAKILKSLSKYPLPLLSASQLIEMEGVGDKTAHLILKILKKQYEGVMMPYEGNIASQVLGKGKEKSNEKEAENEEKDEEGIDENEEIIGDSQNLFEEFKMQSTVSVNKRQKCDVPFIKELEPLLKRTATDTFIGKDSKASTKSTKSKYKMPDPESTPGTILMALLSYGTSQSAKYASKKEIKKASEEMIVKCNEITNWSCIKTLLKHDILFSFSFDGVEKYCLSDDGVKMAEKLMDYQLKMFEKNQCSLENSKNFDGIGSKETKLQKKLNPIVERNSSEEKTGNKKEEKIKVKFEIPIESIEALNVVLIVDNREIKNQEDRTYIHSKLIENGLDCELGNLPVGDFLWIARIKERNQEEIKLFVLDYIVERKKADDLASSILDTRYTSQKARLKKTNIPNAFWLIEGNPSPNAAIPSHVLDSTVFHLQFTYDFKVERTENLQQSLKWLSHMTLAIQRKIKLQMKTKKPLSFDMTLEDFLLNNVKTQNIIGDIFQNMLMNIKDCGKQACGSLYKNFKTARQLYNKLMSLDTNDERVEMLSLKARKANKKLEKLEENSNEINIRIGLAKKIAILFCEESYPEIVVESNEEDDLDDI